MKTNFKTKTIKVCACGKPRMTGHKKCLSCISLQVRLKQKEQRAKERARIILRKEKKKIKRENNTRLLKKELDRVFSIYIRQRDKGVCFTCGDKKDWQKQQNGHYIKRSNMSLRYSEVNCHCQCVRCNIFLKGCYPEYSEQLMYKYGVDIISKLNKEGRDIKQWTAPMLKEMIERYKTLSTA